MSPLERRSVCCQYARAVLRNIDAGQDPYAALCEGFVAMSEDREHLAKTLARYMGEDLRRIIT